MFNIYELHCQGARAEPTFVWETFGVCKSLMRKYRDQAKASSYLCRDCRFAAIVIDSTKCGACLREIML